MAFVSVVLWILTLFQPICMEKQILTNGTARVFAMDGWIFYIFYIISFPIDLFFSLGGEIRGNIIVATLPMYFICIMLLIQKKYQWLQLILLSISVFSMWRYYYLTNLWAWGDSFESNTIIKKMSGYYLWLSSYVVLLIGVIINTDRNLLKNDINNLIIRIQSAYIHYKSNLGRSIVLTILVVSVVLLVLSLFHPMYQYQWVFDNQYSEIDTIDGYTFYYANIMELPINLYYSLVDGVRGDIIVVTLPIYFLCVVLLVINKNRWLQLALMSISVFSLYLFYFVADLLVDNVDAQKYAIISKCAAYYLWLSSYIVLLIDIITNILIIRYNQKGGSKCIK